MAMASLYTWLLDKMYCYIFSVQAMDIVNEKKEPTENDQSEFAAQRSEAISELMEKSVKQNWQKPKKTVNGVV
jgi:hypothetical protein